MSWYARHLEKKFIMDLNNVVDMINGELTLFEYPMEKQDKKNTLYRFVNLVNGVIKKYSDDGFFDRPSVEKNFRICLWENLDRWKNHLKMDEEFQWPNDDQMGYIVKQCLYKAGK